MKISPSVCAALAASLLPAVALADNPNDPAMRDAAARARDREDTRKLNLGALRDVREREARGELGWRPARATDNAEYAANSANYRRGMANYARDHAQYEREMAAWRRAVAACRAGDYAACNN